MSCGKVRFLRSIFCFTQAYFAFEINGAFQIAVPWYVLKQNIYIEGTKKKCIAHNFVQTFSASCRGKHMPEDQRERNRAKGFQAYNISNVLPVVSIRDPYTWMQSM